VTVVPVQGLLGILFILALSWAFSENRRAVSWRLVVTGVAVQLLLALVLLKAPVVSDLLQSLNRVVLVIEASTRAGTSVVFG
jgi:CNT family concentrative nucleoside transporter